MSSGTTGAELAAVRDDESDRADGSGLQHFTQNELHNTKKGKKGKVFHNNEFALELTQTLKTRTKNFTWFSVVTKNRTKIQTNLAHFKNSLAHSDRYIKKRSILVMHVETKIIIPKSLHVYHFQQR